MKTSMLLLASLSRRYIAVPLLSIALSATASAATVTFQQGQAISELGIAAYSGTENLTLIGGSFSAYNYGNSNSLWAGLDAAGAERKLLLRFDLTSLANIVGSIESVTLTMTQLALTGSNSGSVNVNLHAVSSANSSWVQGSQSGKAQSGSSSWDYRRHTSQTWAGSAGLSTPGTDYIATAIDDGHTVTTGANSSLNGKTYQWTLSAELIEEWIAGNNAGLLFTVTGSDLEAGDFFRFASSTYANDIVYRPALTINYLPVPEPGSIALLAGGAVFGAGIFMRGRRRA